MRESKSILEIGTYLNSRVKELAFENVFHFLMDCISNGTRLANDKEVSEILYDTIKFGGLYIPKGINTSKFTIKSLLIIADSNFKPTYCKERLAKELKVHEQTINKWLMAFDEDLYSLLYNERKLTFYNLYQIMIALGLDKSRKILARKELCKRCNLKSSDLKRELPRELEKYYEKFIKYPPVYSNQVLDFFDQESDEVI